MCHEIEETMEGRAHSKGAYSIAGDVSRMEDDLAKCSRDLKSSFEQRPPTRRRENVRDLHVCIIGAGLAGLRCAEILIEQGVRVTMIEARDRIGGRVSYDSKVTWSRCGMHHTCTHPNIQVVDRFSKPI